MVQVQPYDLGRAAELRAEDEANERDIVRRVQQQRARDAATDRTVTLPARFDVAVAQAQAQLAQAQEQLAQADHAIRQKLGGLSPALQRLRFEDATADATAAVRAAEEHLALALEARGAQVLARQQLAQLEASAPGRRAAIEQQYRQQLAGLEQELTAARARVASS